MRNFQAEWVLKLPRFTYSILLLLILTGSAGIAQPNTEDSISSIHGTSRPAPARRAATVHKYHRPIIHVVIRQMVSPPHVVHFALRHIASARTTHHKKLKHRLVTVQANIPRHQTMMRKPFLEGKQTTAAVVSLQQNRKWVAQDQKYVDFSSSGVRFVSRDAKQGPNKVTTKLNLPAGAPWKVAFEVQLFPAANGGMSVYLYQGSTELGWIGAGDFYKALTGFLGTGISNSPYNQPWDNNWHSFVYASDGKMLSLWHNGSKCGETPLAGTPDTFIIQSIGMELRVRNVHVETLAGFRNVQETQREISPPTQALPLIHWSTNGNNQFLEVNGGEVHLKPRIEGTGPGNVTAICKFTFPNTQTWHLSFDIRYGILRDQAGGLSLYHGGSVIGHIAADGATRDMGVFLGKDNEIWRMTADTEWHHLSFMSDGSHLTVGCDGQHIGGEAAQNIPDSIDISNSQDMNVPCHQEGIWVRNITFHQISTASRTKINPKDGAEMVYVDSGPFLMGDDDIADNPRHTVTLSGYYIYRNDVTVAMYRRFCQATGRAMPPPIPTWGWMDGNPIVDVSWDDAKAYCDWAGVHLPTEAQWEKAARGTDGRFFPWGNNWDTSRLRCSKNNVGDAGSTAPAGSISSGVSPCGALDMAGNVWQWCANWYDENDWKNANEADPTGPRFATRRVERGGSWGDVNNKYFRTAFRLNLAPDFNNYNSGFRGAFGP